jgi:hypothetical protein
MGVNLQQVESAIEQIQAVRTSLTVEQARLLNHVWSVRLRGKRYEWRPALHTNLALDFPGTDHALRLAPRGTLFIYPGQPEQYGLTLLGVLLTEPGESYLNLLANYLAYICAKAKEDPRLPDNKRIEVGAALGLSPDESSALGHLIYLANLSGNHMTLGEEWQCGYPPDIDRLRFVASLTEHVAQIAMDDARRVIAQTAPPQVDAANGGKKSRGPRPFRFVRNPVLRSNARVDWREAELAYRSSSWRSCVVACGAVLEGMLLDAAETDTDKARAAFLSRFQGRRPEALRRWTLNELAETCAELGILGQQSLHLTHALRFSRDLVHPGRGVRLRASIGKTEADVAVGTVRLVHRLLLQRRRRESEALKSEGASASGS